MKQAVRTLMIGSLLWYAAEGMMGPLLAVFASRIGGNILDISGAWAIYLAVTGIGMIVVGKISDRGVSKGSLMVAGYALNAVATFGYLFVTSSQSLFIVQAALGCAWALATPTWDALFAREQTRTRDGTGWGFADGLPAIVSACAVVLGGWIVSTWSFQLLFIIMGCIQVAATATQLGIVMRSAG